MKRFWNWTQTRDGLGELRIEQEILQEPSWWDGSGDTPKAFREELAAQGGRDIVVWINSPGGDVFAGASIYTMLREYGGRVTVKVDGIAASAASVIAMAGDELLMSPPSMLMVHRASTWTGGNVNDMEQARAALAEVDDAMAQAYMLRTGLSKDEILALMDAETYMSAAKAVELGFCDGVMYQDQAAGRMMPAACVLTARGVYAYAGKPREPTLEDVRRAQILEACRARAGRNGD